MTTTPTFVNPYPAGTDAACHYDALMGRCIDGTFGRFSEQVAQANFCSHPIRLRGSITAMDSAGKTVTTYSTVEEPDGVLLKACGNRRQTACPSCAALYRSDARHLVRAGLTGGKGMPDTVSAHPMVFATFTAPSFGSVHRGPKDGQPVPCHPGKPDDCCKHGKLTACFARHDENDPVIGEPICPSCYDYTGTVLFNATANTLWRYITTYLRRRLAGVVGMKRCDFDAAYRVSFAKVIEYQKRGVVHVHAVIRVDGISAYGELVCPEAVNTAHLIAATIASARQVGVYYPVKSKDRPLKARWGTQVDAAPINGSTPEAVGKIAAYVAKYATKSLDTRGLLDKRIKPQDVRYIAELLGHSRLETTQRYTQVSIEKLRQVHAATHPAEHLE